jgi:hypothetical protein
MNKALVDLLSEAVAGKEDDDIHPDAIPKGDEHIRKAAREGLVLAGVTDERIIEYDTHGLPPKHV